MALRRRVSNSSAFAVRCGPGLAANAASALDYCKLMPFSPSRNLPKALSSSVSSNLPSQSRRCFTRPSSSFPSASPSPPHPKAPASNEEEGPLELFTALSPCQEKLRDTARKFAEEIRFVAVSALFLLHHQEIRPLVSKMDEEGEMSLDVINALFQQGFMAMGVGTVEGGSDISFTDSLLVIREISRVDPAVGLFLCSHVPESQVLGPLGGWKELTENILSGNKIAIAAQLLGLAEGAFDAAVPFLIEKENAEQKRLKDFQGIRFRAAELASEIESVRALVLAAALLRSRSLSVKKEAAIAKYKASLTAEKVASACIEFFGGLGCSKDFPAEKYLRDAKMGALYGGTNNLQMETIFDSIEEEYV
ncbi:acyl-dehydrogenase protein [Cyclospora cayetanensis]|uniref:Acyl-dehydrogenase protein n=1 Tax=Cyclospora cayetanensis TaxID=88456 RepID=A0A1D3CSI1_9EIME|nr:acyl-dehydrogenase protein [Cyclospora cayetanensis]